jgi:hypothetical protein
VQTPLVLAALRALVALPQVAFASRVEALFPAVAALTAREDMGAWAVRACISEVLVKCVQPMLL